MDIKNEFIEFMENKFKYLVLKQPLFYDFEYALRFGLHDIVKHYPDVYENGGEYFIQGLNRAKELFIEIFNDCNELFFVYRNNKIEFSDKIFENVLDLKEDEIAKILENGIYEENIKTCLAVIKLNINRINYENISNSINNTDFGGREPRTDGEVYFVHIKNEIIFQMYDDRGVDIIGANKKSLEHLYKNYNKWLIDYDREKMVNLFK